MKKTADIVIIGGGCMGTSTAYHLARRGLTNVVLVEREALLGTGSTGRNAGGVRHQFSSEANVRLSMESIQAFERFREEIGYEIDFHQDGYLFLLSTAESVDTFRRNVEMQRRLGVDVAWLSAREAAGLAPGLDVQGVVAATFCARDGIADPNGVTVGFANAARSLGVEVVRETEALAVRVERGRVAAVETTRGEISTRTVVNAAGPYARRVGEMAGVDIPVLPYRRHIFFAQPAAPGGWDLSNPSAPDTARVPSSRIMVIDFDTTFYFHREGANLLFGMSDPHEPPGFDTTVSWDFLAEVTEVATALLPALADARVSHAWAGLYEVTPDAMPIIGPAKEVDGFFLINGFSGHGFQHSPASGRILADLIVGRDPGFDPAPFALDRFARGGLLAPEANVV